jgi:hypothetical protein
MKIRGNSLVGMLVTLAIICILMVVVMRGTNMFGAPGTGSPRKDGRGTTVPGLVKADAQDVVCRSNLGQLRQSLQIAASGDDDKPPATLQETRLGREYYKCPMGGEPYVYDPTTGQVHCTHPGHEKF